MLVVWQAQLAVAQSVLLGATFPLMTGGVLRLRPERAGYVVAMLYFTNSIGAAGRSKSQSPWWMVW